MVHRVYWMAGGLALATVGCLAGAPVARRPLAPDPSVIRAPDDAPGFALTIGVRADGLEVTTIARGDGLERWSAVPRFEELTAEDARGPLAARIEADVVTFDRPIEPPLTLRYRVPAHEARDELAFGDVVRFDGRALLLPSSDSPRELSITIEGVEPARVASTLGLAARRTLIARPIDLRDVTWAIGSIEHASFEAREGRDVVARIGGGSYDVRWVGAEIALMRTRIDGWFGGLDAEPHTTLLVARAPAPGAPPVRAARSGIGLVVLLAGDARWDAAARLAVAQVLARRWLGGVLRLTHDGADDAWASYGVTRWIAQEILLEMGTLTIEERAADLTQLEGVLALADPGDATLPIARGALYGAALDARLRARGERMGVRGLVLELLAQAEDARGTPIEREVFLRAVHDRLGDEEVRRFDAQVAGAAPIEVPAGTFGPCLRRGRAVHRRFALGLTAPPDEGELEGVIAGGPAHRAGLRDGVRARDPSYTLGRPDVPARVTVLEDPPRVVEWLPFDREVRGLGWERAPRVPEERCAER